MTNKSQHIAIVGSGLAGMTLALALSQLSVNVTLIEAKPKRDYKPNLGKAIALNYASINLLKKLNIWETIKPDATPIEKVHISEKGRFGKTELDAAEVGYPALGYLIRESNLSGAIASALKDKVTWLHDTRLVSMKENNQLIVESNQEEKNIHCQLLVACDGIDSKVRELLNIETKEKDYPHSALVSQVQLKRSHHNTAYERFTKEGTIAMLPLQNNQCAVIITGDNAKINYWEQLSDDEFLSDLQEMFGYRLGRFLSMGKRLHFPLKMMQATQQVKPGVVLLGHSAHVMHPVAAQGLNLSFRDIATFIDLLTPQFEKNADIADIGWLKAYEQARAKDQKATMRFTQLLVDIFSSDVDVINRWRKLGILGIEFSPTVKRMITKFGAGFGGKVASLLMEKNS